MTFLETPRFPVDLNYGSVGGPVFKTDIVVYGNGHEYRNSLWSTQLNRYDARYAVKSRVDLVNVYEFFIAQQGSGSGFRIKDLFDFTSATDGKSAHANTDVLLGVGDGIEVDFQIIKNYTKGISTTARKIIKPVVGSTLVRVDGVSKTESVDYSVDSTAGIITFNVAPADTVDIEAGFIFDVPARFDSDDLSHVQLLLYTTLGSDLASIESIPLIEVRE
jgi:uncharacterized protein (TIGR02217 family)